MTFPTITHLQYAVLVAIGTGPTYGSSIRCRLAELGCEIEGPAFYQMMARLERDELIVGEYQTSVTAGQTIKSRFYTPTAKGRKKRAEVRRFYESLEAKL